MQFIVVYIPFYELQAIHVHTYYCIHVNSMFTHTIANTVLKDINIGGTSGKTQSHQTCIL